jgi:hypothetical protein
MGLAASVQSGVGQVLSTVDSGALGLAALKSPGGPPARAGPPAATPRRTTLSLRKEPHRPDSEVPSTSGLDFFFGKHI